MLRLLTLLVITTLMGGVLSSSAHAEWKILLGSYHLPRGEYCEFNPGVGYTFHEQLTGMVYKNSECDTSLMVSWTNPINETFSYSFGGASGYTYAPIVPFVSLNAKVTEHTYVGVMPGSLLGGETVFFYGVNF